MLGDPPSQPSTIAVIGLVRRPRQAQPLRPRLHAAARLPDLSRQPAVESSSAKSPTPSPGRICPSSPISSTSSACPNLSPPSSTRCSPSASKTLGPAGNRQPRSRRPRRSRRHPRRHGPLHHGRAPPRPTSPDDESLIPSNRKPCSHLQLKLHEHSPPLLALCCSLLCAISGHSLRATRRFRS